VGVSAPLRSSFENTTHGMQRVVLSGTIDENADLDAIFAKLSVLPTVLNLRAIERVNSIGVHRWIPLVTAAAKRHPLEIEEISYALVQTANVVANLFGAATLHSCMAPYFCARCNDNLAVVVTAEEVLATELRPPAKRCIRCNSELEFDELDGYFALFKNRARR
jgi:DNA-directed RNA polymerase subunit RPC12/RpoP